MPNKSKVTEIQDQTKHLGPVVQKTKTTKPTGLPKSNRYFPAYPALYNGTWRQPVQFEALCPCIGQHISVNDVNYEITGFVQDTIPVTEIYVRPVSRENDSDPVIVLELKPSWTVKNTT